MNDRGWADVGYSYAVCPHGIVMEGRGFGRVQAAQPGGNSTWTSCTFMSGPTEDPTPAQINAFRELRAWLRGKGLAAAIRGHRDFISTSCPGDRLYRLVKNGTLTGAPSQAPQPPPQEDVLKTIVDMGSLQPETIPAGQRRSLDWEIEYADPDGVHTDASSDTRYPSIFPRGGDAPYAVTVEVFLAAPPPSGVHVYVSSYARNEDTFERDIRGGELRAQHDVMTGLVRMSDGHKYRADIVNESGDDVTVERAYMLIAR
jgi:hypothetical protein